MTRPLEQQVCRTDSGLRFIPDECIQRLVEDDSVLDGGSPQHAFAAIAGFFEDAA
ncbi:MAG: hypothetical protein M3552_07210 [Planctomycetota bacterium]|nr:hypothetical protein [Planctomycetaceae bacterium]MDQ3330425.1 hypothetical protein [Planctomycetota bacterium]